MIAEINEFLAFGEMLRAMGQTGHHSIPVEDKISCDEINSVVRMVCHNTQVNLLLSTT